jgi:hypothetical protein
MIMSVSHHQHTESQLTQNQKNQMSEDPRDGARGPDAKTKGGQEPTNQIPEEQAQDQSLIEAFGQEGAGIAAKE